MKAASKRYVVGTAITLGRLLSRGALFKFFFRRVRALIASWLADDSAAGYIPSGLL